LTTILSGTRNPILIDHKALVTATSLIDGSQHRVPLEEYLFALTHLWRLGPALQAFRQESHKNPSGNFD